MVFQGVEMQGSVREAMNADGHKPAEVRCAVRFPLHLPVKLITPEGEQTATTENISANGVLFRLEWPVEVNSTFEFKVKMPAEALGTPTDVVVHCLGRVVRSYAQPPDSYAAAVIDEYRFGN